MKKKIIFRQADYSDFMPLYDDDGIKETSGKNNALYIVTSNNYSPVNGDEYQTIKRQAEEVCTAFEELANGEDYYQSFKAILNCLGIRYAPATVHKLKEWTKTAGDDPDSIADFLTITTGEKWNTYTVKGYCQGDFATGIYCKGHHTPEALELYVGASAGTVSEFYRIEGEDFCCGFYVTDSEMWHAEANPEALKKYLASFEGDDPEEISIEFFTGYSQTATYKTV